MPTECQDDEEKETCKSLACDKAKRRVMEHCGVIGLENPDYTCMWV